MELAQAVNYNSSNLPGSGGTTNSVMGFAGSNILWIVLIVAAVIIAYFLISSLGRDRYSGTKGGRTRRKVTTETEYDDGDLVDEYEEKEDKL